MRKSSRRFYAMLAATLCALTVFVTVAATGAWHTPAAYENGDAPPSWVTAWSQANFGHGVEYGGDESTPMEWMSKPFGFKGYSFVRNGVAVYIRLHESSNPMDRGKRYHSYEIYAKDATGAVSFWQGWIDRGDPVTARFAVCNTTTLDASLPAHGTPHGWVNDGCGRETWYTRGQDWQWDIVTIIADATTTPTVGETADTPQSQWALTGQKGVRRQIFAYWYGTGSTRYPTRNADGPRGWFCADVLGTIEDCDTAGALPQYIAPTMPTFEQAVGVSKTYSATGIQVPN